MRPFRGFLHYVSPQRRRDNDAGFSLIETLAALLVFGIITLGLIPLLAASIRGSQLSRAYTSGKNVAVKSMERVRSLPYYISYAAQAKKVDVLDLYFPNTTTAFTSGTCSGYIANAATGTCTSLGRNVTGPTYVTYCTSTQTSTACPDRLPAGFSVMYEASFVGVSTATISCPAPATGTCEQYTKAAPTGYAYNSVGGDLPPKLLMEMVVTSFWNVNGRAREHQVRSLISDRKFGGLKILAEAFIDYGIRVVTGYDAGGSGAGKEPTELNVTAANANARIETRRSSYATQNVRAADAEIVDLALAASNPAAATLATITGLTSTLQTPPDSGPTNLSQAGAVTLAYPAGGYGDVAHFDNTDSSEVKVGVTSGATACSAAVPCAHGNFDFSPGTGTIDLWVNNDKSDVLTELQLDRNEKILEVVPFATNSLQGDVNTIANAIGSGVDATAEMSFWELNLFRSRDIQSHSTAANEFASSVIAVTGPATGATASTVTGPFEATATCEASTTGSGGVADATFGGSFWYYQDNDPAGTNDNNSAEDEDGSYQRVSLAPTGTDPLAAVKTLNPLVYDATGTDSKDVYLFEIPQGSTSTMHPVAHTHAHLGYLSEATTFTTSSESIVSGGRVTSAGVDKALFLQTSEMEPSERPDTDGDGIADVGFTALGVSVGSVGCRAEDYR